MKRYLPTQSEDGVYTDNRPPTSRRRFRSVNIQELQYIIGSTLVAAITDPGRFVSKLGNPEELVRQNVRRLMDEPIRREHFTTEDEYLLRLRVHQDAKLNSELEEIRDTNDTLKRLIKLFEEKKKDTTVIPTGNTTHDVRLRKVLLAGYDLRGISFDGEPVVKP